MNVYEAIEASPIGLAWYEEDRVVLRDNPHRAWHARYSDGWQPLHIGDELETTQAENVRLRAENEALTVLKKQAEELLAKITADRERDWCDSEGECWLADGPCAYRQFGPGLSMAIEADEQRQGEIDTAATIAEENEDLRAALRKLVEECKTLEMIVAAGTDKGSSTREAILNQIDAAIAEAERLLRKEGE